MKQRKRSNVRALQCCVEHVETRRLMSVAFQPAVNSAANGSPQGIASADFNGDQQLDIAVTNFLNGTVSVLLGNGDGSMGKPTSFAVGPNLSGISTGDFNADGKQDLAIIGDDLSI